MAFPQPTAANTEGQLIVEWRAGRCRYDEAAKKVHPDPRKGMFRLVIADDGITHVHWLERNKTGAAAEHDFLVIGDAYLEKLDYVNDGRCYILKFDGSPDRKFFIWQQEPDEEKDAEFIKQFNDKIDCKARPGAGAATSTDTAMADASAAPAGAGATGAQAAQLNDTLAALLQQQGGGNIPPEQLAALQQMLAGAQGGAAAGGAPGAAAAAAAQAPRALVNLSNMLKKDELVTLMQNEEAKKELTGMLPGKHDDTELESMLRSVQLSGALGSLTQAVYQGSNALLFASLGLDNAFITPGNEKFEAEPMKALCKALEAKHKPA